MKEKDFVKEYIGILKDTIQAMSNVVSELGNVNTNMNELEDKFTSLKATILSATKHGTYKWLIRVIVFQSVIIALLSGIQVGQLTGFWQTIFTS